MRIRNASQHTNFTNANSVLTEIASELLAINCYEQESYEDAAKYNAPSECYIMIRNSYTERRNRLFQQYCMDADLFFFLLKERTSELWVFKSGLMF